MAEASAARPGFTEKYAAKVCSIGLTIVGLGALVAALSGPLYQAGIVGLMPAFGVLRYAIYALGAGAALCVIGFVFGIIAFKGDALSNVANGLLGIIIAGAVFLVPYGQMSRNAPPIHEITTDFDNP
ncbi:MAG: hypothetical protein ACPHGY_08080, partial [Rhodospirillaceae bacterium]